MKENDQKKFKNVHYQQYLALDELLSAQQLRSTELRNDPAHDEMLFIITHQVYELWFKQIIHELDSLVTLFRSEKIDERNLGIATHRLERIIEIQKLIINQIGVMETMTPLDFLDFRNYLFPASGFQSFQFRKIEAMLGLENEQRITYNNKSYDEDFPEAQRRELAEVSGENSLFRLVENWLERTPFLQLENFDFVEHYREAVKQMLSREEQMIRDSAVISEEEKEKRLEMLGNTDTYYQMVFNPSDHGERMEKGQHKLSYRATLAALLINLYRDEPILQQPFKLLTDLVEMDEHLTAWRYRHAQMVLRMLGKKVGTGGSSGYDYLNATASRHHIFADFHMISTLLIPRSELPELPAEVKQKLGFYYSA